MGRRPHKSLEKKIVESFGVHGPSWLVLSTGHLPYQEEVNHEVLYFKWQGTEAYGEVMIFLHRSPESRLSYNPPSSSAITL